MLCWTMRWPACRPFWITDKEEMIATCIGCGCTDKNAGSDEAAGESCSWLAVDYDAGVGVCSTCPDDLERWNAGDRTATVPAEREETVLQTWVASSGQWAGRILRAGIEDGRVAGCSSQEDVICQAIEGGIDFDRVEPLDHIPPVE